MFSVIWNKNIPAIPVAISEPNSSGAVFAILSALVINITYITTIPAVTTNPSSSPITEKIKSVDFGYKNPNWVWFPFKYPIPNNLPDPIAIFDCVKLYPAPLGSADGFKKTSILFLACGGNT